MATRPPLRFRSQGPLRPLPSLLLARRRAARGLAHLHRKGAAQAWLSTTEADIVRGTWIDPEAGKTTVADIADRWLKANVEKRSSSRDRDGQILGAHVLPALGSRPVASLTRADIQLLVDGWVAQLSPSTVARMYSTLRALLNYAEAANLILRSPCRRIRLRTSR